MSSDWSILIEEILKCIKCPLHLTRKNPVPGEGDLNAKLMFVGEAPGANEDEQGRPFVGAAGKLLTELIESIGLTRGQVYITNIVKCRPPYNRDPTDEEINACSPYLIKQIEFIKPKLIVALGRHSGRFLVESAGLKWISMSANRGRVYDVKLFNISTKLIVTYHPAAALYNPRLKPILQSDFELIKRVYIEITKSGEKVKRTILDYLNK